MTEGHRICAVFVADCIDNLVNANGDSCFLDPMTLMHYTRCGHERGIEQVETCDSLTYRTRVG
jgi:hypothetical protein